MTTEPKQSFAWWSFAPNIDPKKLIKGAADIGYKGIDIPPDDYLQSVKDHGLEIVNLQAHLPLEVGLCHRKNLADIKEKLIAKLELAEKYEVKQLIVFSGNRNGISDGEAFEPTVENLKELVTFAEAAGVILTLEMLNSKVDHPDYQSDQTPWAAAVCKEVNSAHFKLLYDIYHMQVMEGDIIATIQNNVDNFVHYHTAGCPGRQDLDDQQEIAYPAVFKAIKATGYDGFIAHEFLPKGEPLTALKEAFELTRSSWV